MSHVKRLRIAKGGKLYEETWENKKQEAVDRTDELFVHLYNICYIEEGVVLKDIMLLVKDWTDILSPLLTASPDWLKEIVNEGLNKPFKNEGDKVEYLELSWEAEVRKYKGEPQTFEQWLSFNGIGKNTKYAIDFSPVNTLSELPVKLKNTIKIEDARERVYPQPVLIEAEKVFKLSDILYGIFWELSFLGSPTDRDAFSDRINQQIEDIKNGTAKTVSWEEIKEKY